MDIPLIDLQRQWAAIGDDIKRAVCEALDGGRYALGPPVDRLEADLARRVGADHGIAVSSGTDALLMALMALGIKRGDIVLTTPYSFFATAGVIARVGATPAFVDIEPDTYNLDPGALQAWFSRNPDRAVAVKAIMPVHLYGQAAKMEDLWAMACDRELPIIEDAAQAIDAAYPAAHVAEAQNAGAMGLAGCFSFYPTKNLGGIGEGGFITTNDVNLAETLRSLRNHGSSERYRHDRIGGNFRMDAVQAAALNVKLEHLDAWQEARRERAAYYDAGLAGLPLTTPAIPYGRRFHTYHQYVIRVPEHRDALRDRLQKNGIGSAVFYPVPFHLQPCFEYLGYGPGDFPEAEAAADETLALPMYPELPREHQDTIIAAIGDFFAA